MDPAQTSLLTLVIGALIVASLVIRSAMSRMQAPALVGFIALGLLLRLGDDRWSILGPEGRQVLHLLAGIGIIALLFRIGLESDLVRLRRQLPRALPVWIGNVTVSGLAGFALAKWLLGIALLPSLFVAVALTATSVGVSVSVWQDARALQSANGALLIDIAEMDDISGVALMALLFAVAPKLQGGADGSLLSSLGSTGAIFAAKLVAFVVACYVLSRFLEPRITSFWRERLSATDMTILVAGIGIIIAATADALGFSFAIGALFAGFVFSRDRDKVQDSHAYGAFLDLFMPFFFIGIGLTLAPGALVSALTLGLPLVAVAIAGKLIGTTAPALLATDWTGAILLGTSMVPRAEIAMIVMQRGQAQGHVPQDVFGAMVLVTATTCVITPFVLKRLLRRWPQGER